MQTMRERIRALQAKAVDDEHTTGMIALIPDEETARTLVIGDADQEAEPWFELHVTLAYLGKASYISETAKLLITDAMNKLAQETAPFDARSFAVNLFNPKGDEPCLVLGIGGDELDPIHDKVINLLKSPLPGFELPVNHTPWIPHMTLKFFEDEPVDYSLVQKVAENLPETIRISGIRVAFAGSYLDFPLAGKPIEPVPAEADPSETKPTSAYEKADRLAKLTQPQKCKYCDEAATHTILHSEGRAYIPACDGHLGKGKEAAANCVPGEEPDPSNIDKIYRIEGKAIRHVRTPAGQRRYDQPIGSVIVADGHRLPHLKVTGDSEFEGWVKVHGTDGKDYEVGKDGDTWYATGAEGGWDDVVAEAPSEEALYKKLDTHIGSAKEEPKTPSVPKTSVDFEVRKNPSSGIGNILVRVEKDNNGERKRSTVIHWGFGKKPKDLEDIAADLRKQESEDPGSTDPDAKNYVPVDEWRKKASAPSAPTVSSGPGFKKVKSEYDGYDQYEGDNGKTLWSYKEGSKHVIVDEDNNVVEEVGRNELLGALHRLLKKDENAAPPKKDPVDAYPNITRGKSDWEGYDLFKGKNGKNLWVRKEGRTSIIEDDDSKTIGSAFTDAELYGQLNKLGAEKTIPTAPKTPKPPVSKPKTPEEVNGAIGAAYRKLTGKDDYVRISDLRKELDKQGLTREQVDAQLRDLNRNNPNVHLIPNSQQGDITPEERAGAIQIGNQDQHLIQIKPDFYASSGAPKTSPAQNARLLDRYAKEETHDGETLHHPKPLQEAKKRLAAGDDPKAIAGHLRVASTQLRRQSDYVRRNTGGSAFTTSSGLRDSQNLRMSAAIYARIADRLDGKDLKKNDNGSKIGPGGQGHIPEDPDKVVLTKPKDLASGAMVNVGEGGWKYIGEVVKVSRQSFFGNRQGTLEGQYRIIDPWGEQIAIMSPNHTVEVDTNVPRRSDMRPKVARKPYPSREVYYEPAPGVAGQQNPFEDNYPDFDYNSQKIYGKPIRYEFRTVNTGVDYEGRKVSAPDVVIVVRRVRDKNGNWTEQEVSRRVLTGSLNERRDAEHDESLKFQKLVQEERAKAGVSGHKPWSVPSQPRKKPTPAKNTTEKGMPLMFVKAPVITPGGRAGDNARHGSRSNGENWVERSKIGHGELPEYIRIVRNGLMKKRGLTEGAATALAVAAMKRWARGGDHVTPKVQAAAAAALAKWEAMKAEKSIFSRIAHLQGKDAAADVRAEVDAATRLEKRRRNLAARKRTGRNEDRSWNKKPGQGGKWDEAKHPRKGGKFAPKGSSSTSQREGDSSVPDSAKNKNSATKEVPASWKKRLPIGYGAQGSHIQRLQEALSAIPGIPKTEEDGIYGKKTTDAVKAFQKMSGLSPTGKLDEDTFAALINYKPKK